MDESQVKKIISEQENKGLYGISNASHTHNGIDAPRIKFNELKNIFSVVATTTNGTVSVPVFPINMPPLSITGVFIISKDTTAGNISLYNSSKTVATIAKGTTSGALVGATTLSNSTLASLLTVQSSSSGNATVFITFTN